MRKISNRGTVFCMVVTLLVSCNLFVLQALAIGEKETVTDSEGLEHLEGISEEISSLNAKIVTLDKEMNTFNDVLEEAIQSQKARNKELARQKALKEAELKAKREKELERKRLEEKKRKAQVKGVSTDVPSNTMTVKASAYTATCNGCSGVTKTGINIRNNTPKIIAVDPSIIPLGSKVEIWVDNVSWGVYSAEDIGGAIKGKKIDILFKSTREAYNFGVKNVKIKIISKG